MSNCTGETPYSTEIFQDASTVRIAMYTIAPILAFFTVLIFIEATVYVFEVIPKKSRRNKIVWILMIYPTFTICSVLALFIPRSSLICKFAASIQLAIAMYQFLKLMVDYFGGREAMLMVLKDSKISLNTLPLMLCFVCLPKKSMNERTLRILRRLVMQVGIVCPIVYFITSVLWTDGRYNPGVVSSTEPFIYLSTASITSTLIAMQALSIVFMASRKPLHAYNITAKYVTVQTALLLSNVQSVFLNLLASFNVIPCKEPFPNRSRSEMMHNFLIVCEFFVLSLMARIFFRRKAGNLEQLVPDEQKVQYRVEDLDEIESNGGMTKEKMMEDHMMNDTYTNGIDNKAWNENNITTVTTKC
ncbi:organic solute transporter subunit alpha-like [Glandiceps talaboti]